MIIVVVLKDLDGSIGKIEKERANNSASQFSSFFGKEKQTNSANTSPNAMPIVVTDQQQQQQGQPQQMWRAPDSWVVTNEGAPGDSVNKTEIRTNKSRTATTFYGNLPLKMDQSLNSPISPIAEDDLPSGGNSTDLFNVSLSNVPRSMNSKLRSSNTSLSKGPDKLASNHLF